MSHADLTSKPSRRDQNTKNHAQWARRGLAAVGVFALLAACGSSADDTSAETSGGTAASSEIPEEYQRITLVGASQGGVFYNYYVAVSQVLNQHLDMQTSVQAGGTQTNAADMEAGTIKMAVTSPVDLIEVTGNQEAPRSPEAIRTLWTAPKTSWHVIVAEDSGVDSFEDLSGKRVATGITGSIESEIFNVAAECAGVQAEVQNIGKDEAVDAFNDGNVEGWTGLGGLPTGNFTSAFESRGAKLISLEDSVIDCLVERFVYLTPSEIPTGVYPGQDETAATIDQWFYAVVSADMPEDVAYTIAKAIHDNQDELVAALPAAEAATAQSTADVAGFPLHPGTKRLLEELGIEGPALDF